jgi:integrase
MIKTAEERNALGGCVAPKIRRVKETENRIRFLTDDEEITLFQLLEALGYSAQAEAVRVLLYTGFRCGELWKLEKRDVNLIEGTLTLWQTKNGHARTIPILDCIRPIIEARMSIEGSQHLFPEGSNPWLRNAWEKARELMGKTDDPQFVPHMLRHTCATRLSQSGVSLPVIKEWLGHTTIQTTIRYAHFNKKDLLSAAQALSK